jgi:hypothetical protein
MGRVANARNRGVSSYGFGGDVVGPHGERQRVGRVERLRAGRGQRQDLHVDALGVHRRDPGLADVVEPLQVVAQFVEHDALVAAVVGKSSHRRGQLGQVPVLFDRDHGHLRSPRSRAER